MLRTFSIVLTLLLTVFGTTAYADPPGRVARLNYIAGAVSFAPAEAPDAWSQAVLNRPLTAGDRLWADQTGRAELHVGSTAIRLGELTRVDVLNLDDHTTQLRLAQGAVNVRVRDLAPGETIEIATPTGAVLLRQPGSYRVSSDPQGDASRVLVHYGQAEVVTPMQTVAVPSSQAAVIPAGAGIAFEVAAYASADEFDRWSAERDRREDNVASTRYVSREMTGYEDLDQYGAWRTLPEYGAVWVPARVAPGWAPYRHGHWAWVSPWGWTWIDDAPWGFAPFHYGRWVWADSYWAWAPGRIERRPVYAPALVAFVGGSNFHVSVSSGPAVGWFPLGWREPYRPWYRASATHVRNVNVTHVTNIYNNTTVNNHYAYRDRREALTVVPQQAFVSARPVARSSVNVSRAELSRAEVVHDRQPAEPVRASLAAERAGRRPPAQTATREVVALNPPATPAARDLPAFSDRASATRAEEAEPRVRVLRRERDDSRAAEKRSPPQPAGVSQPEAPAAVQSQRAPQPRGASRDTPAPAAATSAPAAITAPASPALSSAPAARAASSATGATAASATAAPVTTAAPAGASPAVRAAPPAAAAGAPAGSAPAAPPAPAVATQPPRAPTARAPEGAPPAAAGPGRAPDSEARGARREPGSRNEAQREAQRERRERVPESAPREPRQRQGPPAAGEASPQREAPRVRAAPPQADAAPARSAQPQPPAERPAVQRQEERRGGRGDPPAAREGGPQRPGRDG